MEALPQRQDWDQHCSGCQHLRQLQLLELCW